MESRKVTKKKDESEERKKEEKRRKEEWKRRKKGGKDRVERKRSGGIAGNAKTATPGGKRVSRRNSRRKKERFAILSVRFWRERPIKKETLAAIALKWKVCVEFNEKTTKRK